MQTITLRLRLHKPTRAKDRLYRELTEHTTALANNLVAAGRPKGLTSRTVGQYMPAPLPSAVANQVIRDVTAHKRVKRFRVLPPASTTRTCVFRGQATSGPPVSLPTQGGSGCRLLPQSDRTAFWSSWASP